MVIVPQADELTVEAKLAPQDIDQVRIGQKAVLRFSAFNQRTTPELNGEVTRSPAISARTSGPAPATTRCGSRSPRQRSRGSAGLSLVPGMPVEAFIQTGERTVLSYLTKPFTDQASRAFKGR